MFDRLTDRQWQSVSHLFPSGTEQRFGRPRRHPRDILEAILWVRLNGEKWHHLPTQYPPAQTCYIKSLQWRRDGPLVEALVILEEDASMESMPAATRDSRRAASTA
jgi:transposase